MVDLQRIGTNGEVLPSMRKSTEGYKLLEEEDL